MTTRRIVAVAAVALFGLGAAACGSDSSSGSSSAKGTVDANATTKEITLTSDQEAAAKKAGKDKLVGIVAATMATEYHKNLNEAAKAKVESYGMKAEIFDSAEDVNKQLEGVEGFITKGAKAIIVTGLGGEGLGPLAKQAADKGILVVELTGRSLASNGAATISVSEKDIAEAEGTAAGEYAAKTYGDKAVDVAITDYPSIESLVQRADMIQAAFLAKYPKANMIGRFKGGTAENGQASMETALQKFPNITGVLGINDAGNLGAYKAMDVAGKKAADAFIFGIDCDPQAVDYIKQGTMYKGCVDTNPKGTGDLAGQAVALWTAGGAVPGVIEVPVSVFTG